MKPNDVTALIASLTGNVKAGLDAAYEAQWDVRDTIDRETKLYEGAGKQLRGAIMGRLSGAFRGRLGGGKSWRHDGWYVGLHVSDMIYLVAHDTRPRTAKPYFTITVSVYVKGFPGTVDFCVRDFMPRDWNDVEALAKRLHNSVIAWVAALSAPTKERNP